ncbi:MAG: zinc ribbon domain-containing protein [Chloroflexi bacterium]|nr:zinc ribbon domain-containing protein [Chloroflexota bacterium]
MTTTLLLALGIATAAFLFVSWPYLRQRPLPVPHGNDRLTELRRQRDAIYEALRELEFDQRLGKLSAHDYAELAERYKRQAVALLKQLDDETRAALLAIDQEIEEEVAQRRALAARRTGSRCLACGARVEASDRFCRQCGVPLGRACSRCGAPASSGDRFCGRCGAEV